MNATSDDELFREIRRRVAIGRKNGKYPEALDRQLASTFDQIVKESHDFQNVYDRELLDLVEDVKKKLWSVNGVTSTQSRFPGGSWFHRLVRAVIARQTRGLAAQVQELFVVQQQLIEALISRTIIRDDISTRRTTVLSQHVIDRLTLLEYLTIEVEKLRSGITTQEDS